MAENKATRAPDAHDVSETDIAQEKMGRNSLQGDDQERVRNQRQAVPDVRQEADGIIETAEKTDKDVRAERDLGKGRRAASKRGEGSRSDED
ncbi:MAG: hypothetical protein R3D44_01305 [Hyphomicrobiaceae bacterium]